MTKQEFNRLIYAIWNDADLQEAISDYGEWNFEELNRVFEIVKAKYLKGE